jgi:hypothetical protein
MLGPVLELVVDSLLQFFELGYGYITSFDMFADFDHSNHIVPDIQKISGCVVRRLLFGALPRVGKQLMEQDRYALADR